MAALFGAAMSTGAAPPSAGGEIALPAAGSSVPVPRPPAAAKAAGCLIEPDRWADVGSPVIGVVEEVNAERGDFVARGQLLVQLRAAVERATQVVADTRAGTDAEVRAAEVAVDLAMVKAQRAESLEAAQFIAPQALEQARSELRLAQHRLQHARTQQRIWAEESRVAQAQLGLRTVRSPFAGVVAERFANPGERVEDRPLMRVAVVDPLRVELMVPVAQWGRLRVGDSVSVLPELPGAVAVSARVSQVDRLLDAASNTFRVRLKLPNPGHKLPAGLRCKVDLDAVLPAAKPAPATAPAQAARPAAPAPAVAKGSAATSAAPVVARR